MARSRAVFFDVGETLVDESREYGTWADWLGVPRHSFSAAFGAVIACGRDCRRRSSSSGPDLTSTWNASGGRQRASLGLPRPRTRARTESASTRSSPAPPR
jgi:hypothetical protein